MEKIKNWKKRSFFMAENIEIGMRVIRTHKHT